MEQPSNLTDEEKYFAGLENRGLRYYYYLNQGLNVLNNFRNVFLGIIALYIALHFDAWWLLIAMFVPSILILTIVGYYFTHKVNRILEWISVRFSSHYAIKTFDYNATQTQLLEEIRDLLKSKSL